MKFKKLNADELLEANKFLVQELLHYMELVQTYREQYMLQQTKKKPMKRTSSKKQKAST